MDVSKMSELETIQTDIVVIGAGGCGMAAAVAAAEKGAKVTVLEKTGAPSGNSIFAFGIFAVESPAQKRLELDVPRDTAFKYAMDWAHWKIDPLVMRDYIDKSGDTIKWLEDMGLFFDKVPLTYTYYTHRTYHCLRDDHEGPGMSNAGREILKVLRKSCDELGVQMFFNSRATKILQNENGEVTGVLATMKDGKELRINAKSVILGTGGYGGDKELLKKHHPSYSENLTYSGMPHLTGDGLQMAMEAGADTDGAGTLLLSIHAYKPLHTHSTLNEIARNPNTVWVNKFGERFTSEWIADHAHAVYRQTDKCLFSIFDEEFKNRFNEEERHPSNFCGTEAVTIVSKLPLNEEIATEASKGGVIVANSWQEIAEWMGIAPEVLEATIEKYNTACDNAYDPVFNKDRIYLNALRTPPYYAVRCYQDFHTAIGNIKINHHMAVINKLGKPVPGLYAGGDTCGSWTSDTYCIGLSGQAFGFAINSGRIAGEYAAQYVAE